METAALGSEELRGLAAGAPRAAKRAWMDVLARIRDDLQPELAADLEMRIGRAGGEYRLGGAAD